MEQLLSEKINLYQDSIKKPLQPVSVNLYIGNLKSLRNKMKVEGEFDNINFLEDNEKVMSSISHLSPNTQRNYLNALIVIMYSFDDIFPKIREIYENDRDKLNILYNDNLTKGILSKKQGENYLPYEDIVKVYQELFQDIKHTIRKITKNPENISISEKRNYQIFVLLSIYLTHPFRNEIVDLETISTKDYSSLTENQKVGRNLLIIGKEFKYSLNEYKTKKHYKEKLISIDKKEKLILQKWIKLNNISENKHLFTTQSTGKKLTRNQLTKIFTNFFKEKVGKSISTTMLTKALDTHEVSLSPEKIAKLKKLASDRGHSMDTMLNIYVVPPQPNTDKESEVNQKEE